MKETAKENTQLTLETVFLAVSGVISVEGVGTVFQHFVRSRQDEIQLLRSVGLAVERFPHPCLLHGGLQHPTGVDLRDLPQAPAEELHLGLQKEV